MKILCFIENKNIKTVKLKNRKKGNPGVGGMQYSYLLFLEYMSKKFKNMSFYVAAYNIENLEINNEINKIQIGEMEEIIEYCIAEKIDIIITSQIDNEAFYTNIEKTNLKVIIWGHNFIGDIRWLEKIKKIENIKKYVCVSKEQLGTLSDDTLYNKSTYIFNMFDYYKYPKKNKDKIVTFIGNLSPNKGVHIIAKCWKGILEDVPDAKLCIIGSSNLYNSSEYEGKYGIGDRNYEKKIMKYLSDENLKVLDSVKFCGKLGEEKNLILENTKVGVSNLSGKRETFGLVPVEFQAMGVPVVAKKTYGYLDTIKEGKSGFFFYNETKLKKIIIELLKDENLSFEYGVNGVNYVRKKFNPDKICDKWNKVILDVYEDNCESINEYKYKSKINRIRDYLRKIKNKKIEMIPSSLEVELKLKKWYLKFKSK